MLGNGFAVVGWEQNPKRNLSVDAQLKLSSLGCMFLTITPSSGPESAPKDYFRGMYRNGKLRCREVFMRRLFSYL